MNHALTFVLLCLALTRLLQLVQADHITERLREQVIYNRWPYDAKRGALAAQWLPENREIQFVHRRTQGYEDVRPSPFGYWLSCPWCMGLWASAAAVAILAQLIDVPLPLLWWPAVSQCVGWLRTWR